MITAFIALLSAMPLHRIPADADRVLVEHRVAGGLPGVSAAIVMDGDILYAGATGVADLETGRPMTADTPLYAGSLSKIFTAVLVLDRIEQGELGFATRPRLDAPVDATSVIDLMTHTAGLPREGDFGYWFSGHFPARAELVGYLRRTSLDGVPGERERYSNIGYAVIGHLLEQASGRNFADLLADHVLEPLGLASTGSGAPPSNLSRGYTPAGRLLPNDERPFAGVGALVGDRHLREYHRAQAMTPAFGLYSTSRDLATLAAFVLDRETVAGQGAALLDNTANGRSLVFGIATLHGRTVARHGGWFAAHRSYLLLDPDAGVGIAVMTNSDDGSPGRLAESLHGVVIDALSGPGSP